VSGNSDERSVRAQGEAVDSQPGRHGDGGLGRVVGVQNVPDPDVAVLAARDQQPLLVAIGISQQRLPLETGDGTVMGGNRAAIPCFVPDLMNANMSASKQNKTAKAARRYSHQ
jgi:hypothetical protein